MHVMRKNKKEAAVRHLGCRRASSRGRSAAAVTALLLLLMHQGLVPQSDVVLVATICNSIVSFCI